MVRHSTGLHALVVDLPLRQISSTLERQNSLKPRCHVRASIFTRAHPMPSGLASSMVRYSQSFMFSFQTLFIRSCQRLVSNLVNTPMRRKSINAHTKAWMPTRARPMPPTTGDSIVRRRCFHMSLPLTALARFLYDRVRNSLGPRVPAAQWQ